MLSQKTRYAIRAMQHLADRHGEGPVPLAEIAAAQNIPANFLTTILSELSRVGARRPAPAGELTPTERRIAELAAEGLANKEIASRLVVSVHTVEVHLSHAYAKLGIRSRSQLAARLPEPKV